MKLSLPLFLRLQKFIKFLKKILPHVIKLILFNLYKREIPAQSHFDSIYQRDAYEHARDAKEHRAITKAELDDSIDEYEVHDQLDDAGSSLPNF